jgi:hypothetical protein
MIRNCLAVAGAAALVLGPVLSGCVEDPDYSASWTDAPVTAVVPVSYQQQVPVMQQVCEPATGTGISNEGEAVQVSTYCHNLQSYQMQTVVAYDVSYQYGGRVYRTRMDHNPGTVIRIRTVSD